MQDMRKSKKQLIEELAALRRQLAGVRATAPGTDHVLAELPEGPEWLVALVNTVHDMLIETSRDGTITFVSASLSEVLGFEPEHMTGRQLVDLVHPDDRPAVLAENKRAYETMGPTRVRHRLQDIKGGWRSFDSAGVWYHNRAGERRGIALLRDVTESKRAEEETNRIRQHLQLQVERMPVGLILWDTDFRVLSWNPAAEKIFGFTAEEALGNHPYDIIVPKDAQPHVDSVWSRLLEGDLTAASTNENTTKEGRTIICEWTNTPLREADGTVVGILSMIQEITERKEAERALQESQDRFRKAFEEGPIGMAIVGLDYRFVKVNQVLCGIVGYTEEELAARTFVDITHPDDVDADAEYARRLERGEIPWYQMDQRYMRKNGKVVWITLTASLVRDQTGAPLYFLAMVEDVSERRELESQLRQAQKMEAVGRLAGGVAHDFNNLLTVIFSSGEFAAEQLRPEESAHGDVQEILKAATRAASLTRQLLAFSRRQPLEPRVLDLSEVVDGVDKMLRRLLGEDIEFSTTPTEGLWSVRVDPGAFEQVLTNLAVNARDAMPEGGKLTIDTGNVTLDEAYQRQHGADVPAGEYVMVAVSDSGVGMTKEIRENIFDPFFTTKEKGKGTGLGLSTCYGIVKQAGGYIWVYSEPGVGTTFKIYLPRVVQEAEALVAATEPQILTGSETVLVVEDEDAVRRLAVRMLEKRGYRVLQAASGEEALLVCESHAGKIDLLFTDVVMPGLSGKQVAERLLEMMPQMKVLYMSGYTEEAVVHHGVLERSVKLLSKPFTPQSLARRVRQVLDLPEA